VSAPESSTGADRFDASRGLFDGMVGFLDCAGAGELSHAELEERLDTDGRALLRQLLADHLELRAQREVRVEVVAADGVARGRVESGHTRRLTTVFGEVAVRRLAYRAPAQANPYPADGTLNLPAGRHSHGLRRLAAVEAARGSFEEAVAAIERATAVQVGKRQVEELAARAAVDFEGFYAHRKPPPAADGHQVLVLQVDGKGIVMRPDALRPATAKAAQGAAPKLASRLSKGEKRYRKRIAEVGAVHDATPVMRSPADILPGTDAERAAARAGPIATNKWLTASVVQDAATVVARVFDQAERRDTGHQRVWVALVDGANHQLDRIRAEATARKIQVHVLIDFVHVIEYLWKAAWCFFAEADPAAETWVHDKARAVLAGRATHVAGAIRRTATNRQLAKPARKGADQAARYLTNKAGNLDYPTALANGWPIATGVIEGACRHLVADRLDITGARWGLHGAEAVLRLRALRSNGDFDEYWAHHLAQERHRVHESRYADNAIPQAA
jgi:hypothetical protein